MMPKRLLLLLWNITTQIEDLAHFVIIMNAAYIPPGICWMKKKTNKKMLFQKRKNIENAFYILKKYVLKIK